MTPEKALQVEVTVRLRALGVLTIAVPNSIYFPARTDAERRIVARVVSQMKNAEMITLGAPDIIACRDERCCFLELKRPKSQDVLGKALPEGRLSDAQKDFRQRCADAGMGYFVCHTWDEVSAALEASGITVTRPAASRRRA